MSKKVLIGTVKLERDMEMTNSQFSYAADYETLMVKKGEYPVYAYADDLGESKNGKISLGWRNYIGFSGEVISNSFGDKPGSKTEYHQMNYDYILAADFLRGKDYPMEYILRPEWGLELKEFEYDGKRHFAIKVVLKDSEKLTYID